MQKILQGGGIKMTEKKIKRTEETAYRYACPYCNHDFGIIEDADYYFERVGGYDCPKCKKTFKN